MRNRKLVATITIAGALGVSALAASPAHAATYHRTYGTGNTIADARYNAYLQESWLNQDRGPCARYNEELIDNSQNPFWNPSSHRYTAYFYQRCAR
jgi:hypothetical protein